MKILWLALKLCGGIGLMVVSVVVFAYTPFDTTSALSMIITFFMLAVFGFGLFLLFTGADPLQDAIDERAAARRLQRNFRNFMRSSYPFVGPSAGSNVGSK